MQRLSRMLLPLMLATIWVSGTAFAVGSEAWDYSVSYQSTSQDLTIEASLPPGQLILNNDGAMAVKSIELLNETNKLIAGVNSWTLPVCAKSLCKLRYIFALGQLAKQTAGGSREDIAALGDSILSNPSLWLLRPIALPDEQKVNIRFAVAGKGSYATGLFPLANDPSVFQTEAYHLSDLPYTLFGPFHSKAYKAGGASVSLAIIPEAYKVKESEIEAWSRRATEAVVRYFGQFPVPHVMVVVVPRTLYNGPGKSYGDGGAVTINPLSLKADATALAKDWVMTHEMVHLAFPSVPYRHHWIEEGLATYIEPIARIRTGELKAESVFADMIEGMPKGLPQKGDRGLDGRSSWGRTYWGGALFSLLADVALREQTKGKKGLEDALRGIIKEGGTMAVSWDLPRALAAGDKATGTQVLRSLYSTMKDEPVPVDLDALWKRLGVRREKDGSVRFDDSAPLAFVRKGIIQGAE